MVQKKRYGLLKDINLSNNVLINWMALPPGSSAGTATFTMPSSYSTRTSYIATMTPNIDQFSTGTNVSERQISLYNYSSSQIKYYCYKITAYYVHCITCGY